MGKPVATPFQTQVLENHHNDHMGWRVYAVRSAENIHLATVGGVDRYHQDEYCDIANLFRAAPDLLSACEALLSEYDSMNSELRHIGKGRPESDDGAHPDSAGQVARAAIAAAKGES